MTLTTMNGSQHSLVNLPQLGCINDRLSAGVIRSVSQVQLSHSPTATPLIGGVRGQSYAVLSGDDHDRRLQEQNASKVTGQAVKQSKSSRLLCLFKRRLIDKSNGVSSDVSRQSCDPITSPHSWSRQTACTSIADAKIRPESSYATYLKMEHDGVPKTVYLPSLPQRNPRINASRLTGNCHQGVRVNHLPATNGIVNNDFSSFKAPILRPGSTLLPAVPINQFTEGANGNNDSRPPRPIGRSAVIRRSSSFRTGQGCQVKDTATTTVSIASRPMTPKLGRTALLCRTASVGQFQTEGENNSMTNHQRQLLLNSPQLISKAVPRIPGSMMAKSISINECLFTGDVNRNNILKASGSQTTIQRRIAPKNFESTELIDKIDGETCHESQPQPCPKMTNLQSYAIKDLPSKFKKIDNQLSMQDASANDMNSCNGKHQGYWLSKINSNNHSNNHQGKVSTSTQARVRPISLDRTKERKGNVGDLSSFNLLRRVENKKEKQANNSSQVISPKTDNTVTSDSKPNVSIDDRANSPQTNNTSTDFNTPASIQSDTTGNPVYEGSINLRRKAKPELENELHKEVSLSLSIQEAKGLPIKGRNLPEISVLTINVYRQRGSMKERHGQRQVQNLFEGFATIPLNDVSQQSDLQHWLPLHSPTTNGSSSSVHSSVPQSSTGKSSEPAFLFNSSSTNTLGGLVRKRSAPVSSSSRRGRRDSRRVGAASITETPPTTPSTESSSTGGGGLRKIISWSLSGSSGDSSRLPSTSSTSSFSTDHQAPMIKGIRHASASEPPRLPQLRLTLQYESLTVLPFGDYMELRQFIERHGIDVVHCLAPSLSIKQKEELASCLINIHEKLPNVSLPHFVTDLLQDELVECRTNEAMLFRSNSVGSKAVESYLKLVATKYLEETLKQPVTELLLTTDDYEIDPTRVTVTTSNSLSNGGSSTITSSNSSESEVDSAVRVNLAAFVARLEAIWSIIQASLDQVPSQVKAMFGAIRNAAEQHGYEKSTTLRLISGCFFLRLLCPAIYGPALFGLAATVPDSSRVSRNLTLVAKCLQTLANLAEFEVKEKCMQPLNALFMQREIPNMERFLDNLSLESVDPSALTVDAGETSNRVSRSVPEFHAFIDLGYEFAKLAKLLSSHVEKLKTVPNLSELPQLLTIIEENSRTNGPIAWLPDSMLRVKKSIVVGKNQSPGLSGSSTMLGSKPNLLTDHHRIDSGLNNYSSSASGMALMPNIRDCLQISRSSEPINGRERNNITKPSQMVDIEPMLQHTTHSREDISSDNPTSSSSAACNDDYDNHFYAAAAAGGGGGGDALREAPVDREEDGEQFAHLLTSYREQLRQLNACIEQVDPVLGSPAGNDAIDSNPASSTFPDNAMNQQRWENNGGSNQLQEEHLDLHHPVPPPQTIDRITEQVHEFSHQLRRERERIEQAFINKSQRLQLQQESIDELASQLNNLRYNQSSLPPPLPPHQRPTSSSNATSSPSVASSASGSSSSGPMTSSSFEGGDNQPNLRVLARPPPSGTLDYQQHTFLSVDRPGSFVSRPHLNSRPQLHRQSFCDESRSNWPDVLFGEESSQTPVRRRKHSSVKRAPNLAELTRASEGIGIPLSELAVMHQ